jgi:cobalt-zinc-cadmium efflux system outer membrane protein
VLVGLLGLAGGGWPPGSCQAEPNLLADVAPLPPVLSLDTAAGWALQYNPDLAALRQQHGIAAAAVVIARTYPYNPVLTLRLTGAGGPQAAAVTNQTPGQLTLMFQIELWHQAAHRQQAAEAALSRTDSDIVFQEMAQVVRVVRAFQTVLYRQEKLALVEETLRVNERVVEQVRRLVEHGQLRGVDLVMARTDVDAIRAQLAPARSAQAVALAELSRSLGVPWARVQVQGSLDRPDGPADSRSLIEQAFQLRADRKARLFAVDEAEARLRLERADRLGNPQVGPFYEQTETRVQFGGVQMSVPVPIFNARRGELQQRQAEKQRALLELQRLEVQIQQDVEAALARLASARTGARSYQEEVLPNLRAGLKDVQRLFEQGEPGVDAVRILDLERKLLRARDGYLDALWEVSLAHADLAAALGDPLLAVAPCPTSAADSPSPRENTVPTTKPLQ